MKQSIREAIESADDTARSAAIPTYSDLLKLVLRANSLMPHTTPARKKLVRDVVEAVNLIHQP